MTPHEKRLQAHAERVAREEAARSLRKPQERRSFRATVATALKQRARRNAPRRSKKTRALAAAEIERGRLVAIFRGALNSGARALCDVLNDVLKWPPPPSARGERWRVPGVLYVLRNPRNRDLVGGELFDAVQDALASRRKRPRP